MPDALSLEQRTQTRGPDSFANLMPQFEQAHLISNLQSERLSEDGLRYQEFYGGDGVKYGLKEDKIMLHLTDFPNNFLAKDPKKVAQALIGNQRNFFVYPADAIGLEAKASADGVVQFNLSSEGFKRHLQRLDDELSYIEVSTAKLAKGREAFKQIYGDEVTDLFDRVHGSAIYGENGIGALLLKENQSKKTTRIYVINPEYIKNVLQSKESGTMVARASVVNSFNSRSDVYLDIMYVDFRRNVRGVVKETAPEAARRRLLI